MSAVNDAAVAAFLQAHPDFFDRYPDLLGDLAIPHGQSNGSVSLIERQTIVLRERIKALELRMTSMVHNAQDNRRLEDQLMLWIRDLLQAADATARADGMASGLAQRFSLPAAALAIWGSTAKKKASAWQVAADHPAVALADDLMRPICLPVSAHQAQLALGVLSPAQRDAVQGGSVAILPLRVGAAPSSFGLLVFGAPDPSRFSPDQGIDFLERLAELASAALQSLACPRPAAD
ncbi:MAG: DUF484 family protein [Burkholderiaceae bacterium]|jgi:uncharacterized protein YigA (DUF484 family)